MAQKKKSSSGARAAAKPVSASVKADAGEPRSPSAQSKAAARRRPLAASGAASPRVATSDRAATISATPSPAAPAGVTGNAASTGPLPLGTSLSIREVGERAAQLKALFAAGSAVVDAGKLETIDTAGLQLLLAAAAAARRRGLTLKLLGAERLHAGAATALGLADQLAAAAEILT